MRRLASLSSDRRSRSASSLGPVLLNGPWLPSLARNPPIAATESARALTVNAYLTKRNYIINHTKEGLKNMVDSTVYGVGFRWFVAPVPRNPSITDERRLTL